MAEYRIHILSSALVMAALYIVYTSQAGPSIEKSVSQTLTSIYFLDRTLSKTTFEINNLMLISYDGFHGNYAST